MMNIQRIFQSFLAILAVGLLAGCGGGGDGGGSVGGFGGTGITAVGKITDFGSIFVNGIEFDTSTASVKIDDNSAIEDDLKLGMVVKVTGALDATGVSGSATTVEFDDEVQGPISAIVDGPDGLTKTLTVLGVTTRADKASTIFEDITLKKSVNPAEAVDLA